MSAPPAANIATTASIADALRALGLAPGDIVCVHAGMKSLGLVIGGTRAIVEALTATVAPGGTIMMPAFSGDLSDPAEWRHPPVPVERLDEIRAQTPAYDPARTPTRGIGQVAEYFRSHPGVRRSPHPQSSFAALGPAAADLVGEHPYDHRFGPSSPLGRLVELGGKVLLLGAPHDTVSLFHMTQHLVGDYPQIDKAAPVIERGERRWVAYRDIDYPIDWFVPGVAALAETGIARTGRVGTADSLLFAAAPAIDFLVDWRRSNGYAPAGPAQHKTG
ncbi:MAG: AAC(3) family N-acetyltransferase [Alphaproteobacteria bacterium]|jgi:aminoglycoside 3-N-acetyltransferase